MSTEEEYLPVSFNSKMRRRFLLHRPRSVTYLSLFWKIRNHTMVAFSGFYQMFEHLEQVKQLTGAIVETGCWRGGMGAALATSGREVWLFDSFEGIPELTEKDSDITNSRGLPLGVKTGYVATSERHAHEIAAQLGVQPHIIKGWFNDTLSKHKNKIGPVVLLRLDGDTYDSTMVSLSELYDQVATGGVIVIDDYYSFNGCREAVYDFFHTRKIAPAIYDYPYGCAYFRK